MGCLRDQSKPRSRPLSPKKWKKKEEKERGNRRKKEEKERGKRKRKKKKKTGERKMNKKEERGRLKCEHNGNREKTDNKGDRE